MPSNRRSPVDQHPEGLSPVIERNIQALVERRKKEEWERGLQEKIADAVTRFTGSMTFVYIHLTVFAVWILMNVGWLPGPKFDPSLVILAMAASVEAIFLSTFVLITQNRMAALADKRADLDLQISLLSEHEITRLIRLVTAIAERMELEEANAPEIPELEKDVAPEKVLDRIEQTERAAK